MKIKPSEGKENVWWVTLCVCVFYIKSLYIIVETIVLSNTNNLDQKSSQNFEIHFSMSMEISKCWAIFHVCEIERERQGGMGEDWGGVQGQEWDASFETGSLLFVSGNKFLGIVLSPSISRRSTGITDAQCHTWTGVSGFNSSLHIYVTSVFPNIANSLLYF